MTDIDKLQGELAACKEVLGYLVRHYLSRLPDGERKLCAKSIGTGNIATPSGVECEKTFNDSFHATKRSFVERVLD